MRELVGQGKPFYSALDKAAGLLRRKVGTGSEFLKELMSIPGVKQAEIAERGLGELLNAPKMTHEQFMAALGTKPAPAIREKMLANPNEEMVKKKAHEIAAESWMDDWREDDSQSMSISEAERRAKAFADNNSDAWHYMEKARDALAMASLQPVHEQWTMPGGENYREMLIKAPKGVNNQEKIMELEAKLRRIPMFNSTPEQQDQIATYYNQVRDLKAQEAASPKPFQGVPHHFDGESGILASMRLKDRKGPNGEKLLHLEELQSDWHQQGRDTGYTSLTPDEHDELRALTRKEVEDGLLPQDMARSKELEAKIGGVPDAPFKKNWEEMALKRLIHHAAENGYHGVVVTPGAEQADRYSLAKHVDELHYNPQTHRLIASKKGKRLIDEQSVPPDKLESHIGKEAALKVMSQEPNVNGLRSLEGEELQVGGEGMKAFYDKKVPNILNGIGKKYGVRVQPSTISEPVKSLDARTKMTNTHDVHHFPITEEMRQDVMKNGIPLYKSGGIVSTH